MHTELFLIRHGETQWNQAGKYQGSTDIPLSENGMKQAGYLKDHFQNRFDYLYSSPLSRALETARIIGSGSDKEPVISPAMVEINFGAWEGLTLEEIKSSYPEQFRSWQTDEINAPLMSSEKSLKSASIRAGNEILRLVETHAGSRILLIAHGGIIKAGLIGIMDWNMTMYHRFLLNNTAVTKLTFDEKKHPVIHTLNDTSHLPDAERNR